MTKLFATTVGAALLLAAAAGDGAAYDQNECARTMSEMEKCTQSQPLNECLEIYRSEVERCVRNGPEHRPGEPIFNYNCANCRCRCANTFLS